MLSIIYPYNNHNKINFQAYSNETIFVKAIIVASLNNKVPSRAIKPDL